MTEPITRALRWLQQQPDWDRYSVDEHCLQVARAARCTVPEVQAVARDLGLYAEEKRQRPLFGEMTRRGARKLTSTEAGSILGLSVYGVRALWLEGRLTRYGGQTPLFEAAEVEALAVEMRGERRAA